jgi:MerR family transcriptional regulator/heat shock protein HspR
MDPKKQSGNKEIAVGNEPLFTLQIASQLSELPAHSIRQYIDEGLIIPFKLESKRHLFSEYDIQRLKLIRHLIRDRGLNFAGLRALLAIIPCWGIRNCSEDDRKSCGAYSDDFRPCWNASEKGRECRNMDCRECEVYHIVDLELGIKSTLKSLI